MKTYTKEELVELLKTLYDKYKQPITATILANEQSCPTFKVFNRLFGSWKDACVVAQVPYGEENRSKNHKGGYSKKSDRLGEEKLDSTGCLMKIIKYNDANDIVVEYQDKHKYSFETTYRNWQKNKYTNPYAKTIFNVGCVGNTATKVNGVKKNAYKVWYAMLQRCYKECFKDKPTYLYCYVCDEWLCFENFEKWYNDNFYQIKDEIMMLDKDILIKNNQLYCPETCVFVPQAINKLFTKRQLHRGNYPIGVCYDKKNDSYIASCNSGIYGQKEYLGCYSNPYDAFLAYKQYKEYHMKNTADKYKDEIPDKLYVAMYRYKVEIGD